MSSYGVSLGSGLRFEDKKEVVEQKSHFLKLPDDAQELIFSCLTREEKQTALPVCKALSERMVVQGQRDEMQELKNLITCFVGIKSKEYVLPKEIARYFSSDFSLNLVSSSLIFRYRVVDAFCV